MNKSLSLIIFSLFFANPCSCWSCQNGGYTVSSENTCYCQCPTGYSGIYCEINVDFCALNLCLNGGTCVGTSVGYICRCLSNYKGVYCESQITTTTTTTTTTTVSGEKCK
jgi:hypothetical protein